jgi:hypothetical protein
VIVRRNLLNALAPLLIAMALLSPMTVYGHQQKAAITHVLFNERSGNIEVMHRFYIHDAEHAVRQLIDSDAEILVSEQTAEQFAAYVQERFALLGPDGNPLTLSYVGQEHDAAFIWVYQEMVIPENLTSLSVVHNALRDVWEEQSNLVNIERSGKIQSLDFAGSTQWLSVSFDE